MNAAAPKRKYKSLLPVYLKGLASGKYTLRQASESTGYSVQWLCFLKKQYLLYGFDCLEHKNKNRIPHNKKSESLKNKVLAIYADQYKDVNFKYFNDCLQELHGIKISLTTLRRFMAEAGVKSPEARRIKRTKKAKRSRLRRKNEGDLIQIDGTPLDWFYKFGNFKKYCLHGAIDDATGKITGLYFTENECLYGYMEILKQTCETYGVPREIYSDRAAIFCVTPKEKQNLTIWEQLAGIHDKKTQWQRILDDLNVRQILAWSPEAKGRVERMWRTIQGQLPQWLYNNKINSVEAANNYIKKYIDYFNSHYAVVPASPDTFWLKAPDNLDDILCAQITRKTDYYGQFSFHSYKFAIENCNCCSSKHFILCISERGIFAKLNDKYYPVKLISDIQQVRGDNFPQVLENIIFRYLYAYAKEFSA